MIHSILMDEHN